ncbi:MAG: hypothetical protein ABFD89_14365 [Bryobacteraceae bacterium]
MWNKLAETIGALSLCAAIAATSPAFGADLQTWNTAEFTVLDEGRFRVDALGQVRTRNLGTDAYDDRLGTQIVAPVLPRVTLTGAFERRWVDAEDGGRFGESRIFGGPKFQITRRPLKIEPSSVFERIFGSRGEPGFTRFRETVDFERVRHGVSPFAAEQVAFRTDGPVWCRTQMGVRWRHPTGVSLEVGYQFEMRKSGGAWTPRHAIRTTFRFRKPHAG